MVFLKRGIPMLLIMLILLASCGGDRVDDTPKLETVSAGRYTEQALSLPDSLANVIGFNALDGGELWMAGLVIGSDGDVSDRLHVWSSGDFGASWTEQALPWADGIIGTPDSAWFVDDGTLYVTSFIPEGYSARSDTIVYEGDYYFYMGTPDELVEIDATAIREASTGIGLKEIRMTDGGDLLINCARNLLQMSGLSSHVKNEFPIGSVAEGRVITFGDWVLAHRNGQIEWHSLDDGQLVNTLEINHPPATAMTPNAARDGIFYANATGIYEGGQTEVIRQIVDGSLVSLSKPNMTPKYLAYQGDAFFVLCNDAAVGTRYRAYRYAFDEGAPSLPTRQLVVYALEDNKTIRQAIGVFQQEHPDVKVQFDVGLAATPNVSDALRTLSTQLLSGGGPDVLVLDGLPVDSYVERGALVDLWPLMGDMITSGELMTTVANTYRSGDELYALPSRFSVPVLLGIDVGGVDDLVSLVDYYRARDVGDVGIFKDRLLDRFYAPLSVEWFGDGGEPVAESIRRDMEAMKRLYDTLKAVPEDDPYRAWRDVQGIAGWVAHHIYAESYPASIAMLEDFIHLGGVVQMVTDGQMDPIRFFPGEGVYLPRTVLGINVSSGQTDLCEQFMLTVFSEAVLAEDFSDGYGVHMAAQRSAARAKPLASENNEGAYMDMTYNAGKDEYALVVLNYTWPAQRDLDALLDRFAGLQRAACVDYAVKQIAIEELTPYLEDVKTLDEAMDSFANKLQIYLSQ